MLTSAIRTIKKNKLMTFINVLSLAIGISATLVIFLFVQYDYSFDKHVPDKERVYRIVTDGTFKISGLVAPLIETIDQEASNKEFIAPIFKSFLEKIKIPATSNSEEKVFFKDNKIAFVNDKYFELYPHTWLAGNVKDLNKPNSIVLTERNLERFFPKETPDAVLGKTIVFLDSINLQVTGVVKEMTENSEFKFQSFLSTATIPSYPSLNTVFAYDSWNNYNDNTNALIKLKPGVDAETFEKTIIAINRKNKNLEENFVDDFKLQPLSDVHFNSDFNYNATKAGTLRNMIILAIFLLALGIINFINLTTAQSTERAKEIGIRKTLGSSKARLTRQFLTETFLIALTATLLSLLFTPILLKAFEGFIPAGLSLSALASPMAIAFLVGQLLLVTLLAGFYPAWVLTGYSPILALKNQVNQNSNLSRSTWVRKVMTVFQFALAQAFLIAVFLVVKQTTYISNKDLGFQKEAVLTFFIPGNYQNSAKGNILKTRLGSIPEIQGISFGNQAPILNGQLKTNITLDNSSTEESIDMDFRSGDDQYLHVYGIPLIAGRNVMMRDSLQEILINEKALQKLKLESPQEALGLTLNKKSMMIVGVMKDFDITNARVENRPILYAGDRDGYVMHIKLNKDHPETWKGTTDKIAKEFNAVFPTDLFEFKFVDETIQGLYKKEQQLSKLLTWAVTLSIVIAGLGLFGLGLFTANQRTKEIGIRKVLGASIPQILMMLLKGLLSLVAIACLLAFPIAWYFGNKWLEDFNYRTAFSWWIFPVSAMGLLLVATVILLSKTYLAARANPVDSLRDE